MPLSPDGTPTDATLSRHAVLLIGAMIVIGIFLTLLVFYPGVMTYDAKFVYEDIAKGTRGDWQSPVMTVLWSLVDPIAPGSASMFLLIAAFYWLSFGLFAFSIGRRSVWLAVALLLLALSPPAFVFVGIIWRDVLFATAWLLSAALTFAVTDRKVMPRAPTMVVALGLVALGVLIRPNALIAAPLLAGYVVWPDRFSWKRAAIVFVPAAIGFFALVQVVYYGALGATRQHPLQSIMVFDLGGISHFAKQNQYPVTWGEAETQLLINDCYRPTEWDLYWRLEPCEFVMHRLEGDKIFGTPVITDAWLHAITRHPLAYLEHRTAFMWNFLANDNLTMWTADIDHPSKTVFADRSAFNALVTIHNMLKSTPLFRAGSWLLACIAVFAFAWRQRDTPSGALAIGVCGSAAVYVLTFFSVGVASDFRYAYWAVLASIAGSVALAQGQPEPA